MSEIAMILRVREGLLNENRHAVDCICPDCELMYQRIGDGIRGEIEAERYNETVLTFGYRWFEPLQDPYN